MLGAALVAAASQLDGMRFQLQAALAGHAIKGSFELIVIKSDLPVADLADEMMMMRLESVAELNLPITDSRGDAELEEHLDSPVSRGLVHGRGHGLG